MGKTGCFNDASREYVIKDMYPLRPLKNYLWNEEFIIELNQFGFGISKACIDKEFRNLINDCRLFYVKDKETGKFFDVNRNFKELPFDDFECVVGLGYHTVKSAYNGIKSEFTIMAPEKDYVEMHRFVIENDTDKEKHLSVYSYIRPHINLNVLAAYGKGCYDEKMGGLYYSFRPFNEKQRCGEVFYKCSETPLSYSLSEADFLGAYNGFENPAALKRDRLPCNPATFEFAYVGAMQFDITLKPKESKHFYFAAGAAASYRQAAALAAKYSNREQFDFELNNQKIKSQQYIEKTLVNTPDEYIDSTINIWLKRQISLGKTWGRVYGKGFRDVMQDIAAFVSFDDGYAKRRIINVLKYQYLSGNALRQFDPVMDHPYQDMAVWIPMTILSYLKETGDFSILDEKAPYLDSDAEETVFMHLKRGVYYSFENLGKHGLCLWGGGDWNDSIDNAGLKMIGESVWLSIAAVKAAKDFMEILESAENIENAEHYIKDIREKTKRLTENIIKHGFEEDHFIYGINDWGEKVGSSQCKEGKLYLNPQTWAVIAGIFGDKELDCRLMDMVEEKLKCDYGYLQNVPPYTQPDDHIGRLTYFGPGLYENGSVYNHGVMFKVVADYCLGRGDLAYQTLKLIRYDNPKNPGSGVEPYAVSNMYFGPTSLSRKGYAPQSWITGTAGWLYRAVTEFMLGIKPEFNGLRVEPCLPSQWESVNVTRIFRGVTYNITILRAQDKGVFVDGKKAEGNVVPVFEKGGEHNVECRI